MRSAWYGRQSSLLAQWWRAFMIGPSPIVSSTEVRFLYKLLPISIIFDDMINAEKNLLIMQLSYYISDRSATVNNVS